MSFAVTNTGNREGADVPQLYLTNAVGEKRMRLLGFEGVELGPGESHYVTLTADPRLLARFDTAVNQWRISDGAHAVALVKPSEDFVLIGSANLTCRLFGK